jgi:hypothetical protein
MSETYPAIEADIRMITKENGRQVDSSIISIPLIEATDHSARAYETNLELLQMQINRLSEQLNADIRSFQELHRNYRELFKQIDK